LGIVGLTVLLLVRIFSLQRRFLVRICRQWIKDMGGAFPSIPEIDGAPSGGAICLLSARPPYVSGLFGSFSPILSNIFYCG
jgi:hypothetical protein